MQEIVSQLTPIQVAFMFFLSIAGIGAIMAFLIRLASFLAMRQGYAGEDKIEAALMPLLHQAIACVYEAETHALDIFGRALDVADKKEIARLTYGMLKDISVGLPGLPITVRVGSLVTEEQWSAFVQSSYDKLKHWFDWAKEGLLREMKPPDVTPGPEFRILPVEE